VSERIRKAKRSKDPFRDLIDGRMAVIGQYRPLVGYLHADGSVSQYATEHMAWYSFDRAVATCFGSAARRMRGSHSFNANNAPIVAILMVVMTGGGKTAWKHKIELPETIP
jgi:hypothetical protein